jgi:hypothetical protein
MAHFAEINTENNKVIRVLVVSDEFNEEEANVYLSETCNLGGVWIKTSYNTHAGEHILGGTPLRKNYASIGDTWDANRDAFYRPRPFLSWVLNEDTCLWEAPIAQPAPEPGFYYNWNDAENAWAKCSIPLS